MDIASPITAVKGIGEKTQKAFAKMGVYTVGDILLHFPRNYTQYPAICDINDLSSFDENRMYAIHALLSQAPVVKNTGRMPITIDHRRYRAQNTDYLVSYAIFEINISSWKTFCVLWKSRNQEWKVYNGTTGYLYG